MHISIDNYYDIISFLGICDIHTTLTVSWAWYQATMDILTRIIPDGKTLSDIMVYYSRDNTTHPVIVFNDKTNEHTVSILRGNFIIPTLYALNLRDEHIAYINENVTDHNYDHKHILGAGVCPCHLAEFEKHNTRKYNTSTIARYGFVMNRSIMFEIHRVRFDDSGEERLFVRLSGWTIVLEIHPNGIAQHISFDNNIYVHNVNDLKDEGIEWANLGCGLMSCREVEPPYASYLYRYDTLDIFEDTFKMDERIFKKDDDLGDDLYVLSDSDTDDSDAEIRLPLQELHNADGKIRCNLDTGHYHCSNITRTLTKAATRIFM